MLFKYKPSSFFRGISNERLKAIFDKAGISLDVDWENRDPKKDTTVAEKWEAYKVPDGERNAYNRLQEVFQRISIMANSRSNALNIIKGQETYGKISKLPNDFDDEGKWSKTERGAYIYLKEGFETLKRISDCIFAKDASYSEYMVDYKSERINFTVNEELKKKLKVALSDFFNVPIEDREKLVIMESYPMAGTEQNYFFYTKDGDIENIEMRLLNEQEIELKQVRRPYTIVFTCDNNCTIKSTSEQSDSDDERDTDSEENETSSKKEIPATRLSLYALDISAKKRDDLAKCIMKTLGGKPPKRAKKETYLLNCFANPEYKLPDMSDFGIKERYAKRIGIIAEANPDDEMIFTNLQKNNVYDSMRRCFKWCRADSMDAKSNVEGVFAQPFSVSLISFVLTTIDGKQISFDLRKHSCNRHRYPEDICEIINTFIERMGIVL